MANTTMTDLAKKEPSPVANFSAFLDKLKPQIALALPKHLDADRMARLALTAFSTNEKLRACTMQSIAASIMTAGQLGLEPGVNGAGYLVPYNNREKGIMECTFVPGWRGLVDLVARSGRGTVFTGVIFKDQDYTFTDGARRDLVIHNETDLEDPADITHAYAIGWVEGATMPIIELWRVSKIEKHRNKYNKVGKSHYSFRDWEMYCRKVPLLQVLKYMPASIEVSNAIAVANAEDSGRVATIENGIVIEMDQDRGGEEIKEQGASTNSEPAPDKYAQQRAELAAITTQEALVRWMNAADKKIKVALHDDLVACQERIKLNDHQEQGEAAPKVTFAKVSDALHVAGDVETLDMHADMIRLVEDEVQQGELRALYAQLREKLEG